MISPVENYKRNMLFCKVEMSAAIAANGFNP
jgi:hypothetical protein